MPEKSEMMISFLTVLSVRHLIGIGHGEWHFDLDFLITSFSWNCGKIAWKKSTNSTLSQCKEVASPLIDPKMMFAARLTRFFSYFYYKMRIMIVPRWVRPVDGYFFFFFFNFYINFHLIRWIEECDDNLRFEIHRQIGNAHKKLWYELSIFAFDA